MQGHRRKTVLAVSTISAGVLLVCGLAYVPLYDTTFFDAFGHTANFGITPVGQIGDSLELDGARSVAIFQDNGRTYAAVASYDDDGVQILDVTDPHRISPVGKIGRSEHHMNAANHITIFERSGTTYAAVSSRNDHGIQIIDLSDPTRPRAAGQINDSDGSYELDRADGITVFEIGTNLYGAVPAQRDDGVQIIDLSDPNNPTGVGKIDDDSNTRLSGATDIAVYVRDGYTYAVVTAEGNDGVQMLNLTDPTNPVALDSLSDNGDREMAGAAAVAIFVVGGMHYAAVAGESDNGIEILNVTDPTNIESIDEITDTGSRELEGPRDVTIFKVSGSTYAAVAADDDDGVQIINVSDPDNVSAVGRFTDNSERELNGASGVALYNSSGTTYAVVAADDDNGVQIIDLGSLSSPMGADDLSDGDLKLTFAAALEHFVISGRDYAIVTSVTENAVQILDITNPFRPVPISTLTDNSGRALRGALNVAVWESTPPPNTFAVVTGFFEGVQVINITDPSSPSATDHIRDDSSVYLNGSATVEVFEVSGVTYAAVTANRDNAVQILNVNDPDNIVAVGHILDDANLHLEQADVIQIFTIDGRPYGHVITAVGNMQLLNLTDPSNPTALDESTDTGSLLLQSASNNYGRFTINNRDYGMTTVGPALDTVEVYDITDPANPLLVGMLTDTADTMFNGTGGSALYEHAGSTFVAMAAYRDNGVQIFRMDAPNIQYPTVSVDADQTVNMRDTVRLSGTGSDPAGHALTYKWTHNGTAIGLTLTDDDVRATTFTAPDVTSDVVVEFTLTGTNTHGYADSDTMTVTIVANIRPVVNVGPDRIVPEETRIVLAATASDPDNDTPLTILWTYTNADSAAPPLTLSDTAVVSPILDTPTVNGSIIYILTMSVTDSRGATGTDSMSLTVYDVPSPPPIVDAGPNVTVDVGDTVTLTATATEPDGEDMTFSWSCSDNDGNSIGLGNTNSLSITFTAPDVDRSGNTYTCIFTATDIHRSFGQDSLILTVRHVPEDGPRISIIGNVRPTVTVGSSYVDPGAKCTTIRDHSISLPVRVTGSVNTDSTGTYTITYSCEYAGRSTSQDRTVTVVKTNADKAPHVIIKYHRGAVSSGAPNADYSGDAKCTDREDGDISHTITTRTTYKTVNDERGERVRATITYSCTDSGGNTSTARIGASVIQNNSPPTISLHGGSIHLNVGDSWRDPGATCRDAEDGTWTIRAFKNTIDNTTPGHYLMLYHCIDSDGDMQLNGGVRHVYVTNSDLPPTLTLSSYRQTISINGTWSLPTPTCMDKEDGDISNSVYTYGENRVNVHKPGTYRMSFTCEDTAGNFKKKFFEVTVTDP